MVKGWCVCVRVFFFKPSKYLFNPFPNNKFWTGPNLKSLQMSISNLMKMAEISTNGLENTVGKEEIARYEQFLLFPQCFQKTRTADT